MSIDFCHITPTKYLKEYTKSNGSHLILAHLVEQDPQYRAFYASLSDGKYKIMDNSAFEMFKQGRPMYDSSKLIQMAKLCGAHCIVMSDYPKEDWGKTVKAATEMIPSIKEAGFDTFFVPQSEVGDFDGYMQGLVWALKNPAINRIGLSILGCPIAYGVNESKHEMGQTRHSTYSLQRYVSRYMILNDLEKHGFLMFGANKRFHCLGMTDGPREIELLKKFHQYIASWDSSAAVWCGLHGIKFDGTPTGLVNGKFEKEVDFSCDLGYDNNWAVLQNIKYINDRC